MLPLIRTSLLALLVLPVAAQDTGFGVQGGFIHGLESLKKATHASNGFYAAVDYTHRLTHAGMNVRMGAGFVSMPGSAYKGLKTSLGATQVYGDLLIPVGDSRVQVLAGLSANTYTMTRSGTESTDPLDVERHFPVRDVKGLKMGVRLGALVRLTGHWSAEVLLQQTELAGKDLHDPLVRAGGINPAWIQVGARYRF